MKVEQSNTSTIRNTRAAPVGAAAVVQPETIVTGEIRLDGQLHRFDNLVPHGKSFTAVVIYPDGRMNVERVKALPGGYSRSTMQTTAHARLVTLLGRLTSSSEIKKSRRVA